MVNLTIDSKSVTVPEGTTILKAAQGLGINIPTLCYLEGVNEIGACRVCLVEVAGLERLVAACNTPAEEGVAVLTDSPRVREARRVNVSLLLSRHGCDCLVCERSGICALQDVAADLGILQRDYPNVVIKALWDKDLPLQRDATKCIQCLRCVQICDKVQGLHVWDLVNCGDRLDVTKCVPDEKCSFCGQCVTRCPTGALTARDDTGSVFHALSDPDVVTVVQVAPAVRAAWAESLGLKREEATPGKMAAALKQIGFDYVFDTDFAADLTIMEEGTELIGRLGHNPPMFTSCCPGWVRFVKSEYPQLVPQLSTAKSPQQMFGPVAKTWFAKSAGIDPKKLFVVSIMPCMAKKFELTLPGMDSVGTGLDVDLALTTREFARMVRACHINVGALEEAFFDAPLGESTGAGVIFGASGGVMEAALRTVYAVLVGKNPPPEAFRTVRGNAHAPFSGVVEAEFEVPIKGGTTKAIRLAVVSGLANTRRLLDAIIAQIVHYDFVEVMACPGGCAGGGGQPIALNRELAEVRGARLWALDKAASVRFSHENESVQRLYKEYLDAPCSEKAHHLLHVAH